MLLLQTHRNRNMGVSVKEYTLGALSGMNSAHILRALCSWYERGGIKTHRCLKKRKKRKSLLSCQTSGLKKSQLHPIRMFGGICDSCMS